MIGGVQWAHQRIRYEASGFNPITTLHYSVGIEQPITRRLTISALGGFARGGNSNPLFTGNSISTEKIDYLTFAIRANEYIPVGGSDLYISIGPQVGLGIQARRFNSAGEIVSENIFNEAGYKKGDFGFLFAMGIRLPFGSNIEMGFYRGLTNVFNNNIYALNNYNFQCSVGHTLGWSRFKSNRNR